MTGSTVTWTGEGFTSVTDRSPEELQLRGAQAGHAPPGPGQPQRSPLVWWADCDHHRNHRLPLTVLQSRSESFSGLERDWLSLRREKEFYETKRPQSINIQLYISKSKCPTIL